ncbi:MAG TPA: tetratricopeptide repeat protein [Terriglobia bacterium]|nr:tetratricopeptide repeat protein [Terriglobia bacterium]
MKIKSVFLLGPALLLSSTLFAQGPRGAMPSTPAPATPTVAPAQGAPTMGPAPVAPTKGQAQGPMTEKEVSTELKKEGPDQLLKDLEKRGVAFEMDADTEKRLRKAKATDDVIKAVTAAGPKERALAAKAAVEASGGAVLPPAEAADFKALSTELDPDRAIALAEAFAAKYPKSEVLSYAYSFEANAYQTKGDIAKIVEYAEKSLDLKKDNLMSLLLAAYAIPTPQFMKLHSTDEPEQLAKAEGYAQAALQAIDGIKKLPNEQDDAYAKRKSVFISSVHGDLGMIHLQRAPLGLMGMDKDELAKAENEYQQAVSLTDNPDPSDYYRLGEAYRLEGKIDDAIAAFTKASEVGGGAIKQFADQQVAALKKAKAQPAAPAKP